MQSTGPSPDRKRAARGLGRMANGLPSLLEAITIGGGSGMALRTDQLSQVSTLRPLQFFETRAMHRYRGIRQGTLYLYSIPNRLRAIVTCSIDTATKPQSFADGALLCNDITTSRRLVTAPSARFAHASKSTTLVLLVANHGGSLRDGDACSG